MSRTLQQALIVSTIGPTLRDAAFGWTCEDPSGFVPDREIGITPGARFPYTYGTVLAAMADGWRLLAPPVGADDEYEWWLVREVAS